VAASTAAPVPAARLGAIVRAALTDFYFHSLRLVPANLVWGAAAIALVLVALAWPLGGLLLAPILAVPAAGAFRMAAGIVRGEPDVPWRRVVWPGARAAGTALLLGSVITVAGLILAGNILGGLAQGGPLGWAFATLAGWGLLGLWCGAIVAWPVFLDPARDRRPVRDRATLTARLLLVDPVRFGAVGILVALLVVVSLVLTVAILTVSISFVALIACRAVYPVADRLDPELESSRP
jgi:hypothetical protein